MTKTTTTTTAIIIDFKIRWDIVGNKKTTTTTSEKKTILKNMNHQWIDEYFQFCLFIDCENTWIYERWLFLMMMIRLELVSREWETTKKQKFVKIFTETKKKERCEKKLYPIQIKSSFMC